MKRFGVGGLAALGVCALWVSAASGGVPPPRPSVPPTVTIAGTVPQLQEGVPGAAATFTLTRSKPGGPATVHYIVTRAPSRSRVDTRLTPPQGDVAFAQDETSKSFQLSVVDDLTAQQDAQLVVRLTRATGDARLSPVGRAANIKVLDDEAMSPLLSPEIGVRPSQRLNGFRVRFTAIPALNAFRLTLSGRVEVKALRKKWKLRTQVQREAHAGVELGIALSVPRRARKPLLEALEDGNTVEAVVRVGMVDHMGRKAASSERVRLR